MDKLSTSLIALLLLSVTACGAAAEPHPTLGKKPPREILNKDIIALPSHEKAAWIHGAVSAGVTTLAAQKSPAAPCMLSLYEDGDGYEILEIAMRENQNFPASSAVLAVASEACDHIIAQN